MSLFQIWYHNAYHQYLVWYADYSQPRVLIVFVRRLRGRGSLRIHPHQLLLHPLPGHHARLPLHVCQGLWSVREPLKGQLREMEFTIHPDEIEGLKKLAEIRHFFHA